MERKFATAAMVVFVLSAAVYLFKCNFVVLRYRRLKNEPLRWEILTKAQFRRKECLGNLVTLNSALEMHFLEVPGEFIKAISDIMVLTNYMAGGRLPKCPEGGVYSVVGDDANGYVVGCSIHGENPVCAKINKARAR
ncbi:MAG: hypothetical protein PHQ23_02665 [Candidatus Wallbacteria bacterium]|nr:hypothetical protein [Candidatus Wallbacteria bacterium]